MFTLVWKMEGKTQQYRVERGPIRIGRALDNDIILPDISVSRYHAIIVHEGKRWWIRDRGSRNGIRVRDRFVTEWPLQDGDLIWLGNVCLHVMGLGQEKVELQDTGVPSPEAEGTIIQPASALALSQLTPSAGSKPLEEKEPLDILPPLLDIAEKLLGNYSLDEVLNTFMDLVFEQVPAERGFLLLFDENLDELVPRVVRLRESSSPHPSSPIAISRTITQKAFQERVSILTLDAQVDPRFSGGTSIILHGIRSVMCVPLWTRDRSIGVVFVDTITHRAQFTQRHLQLLTLMANLAGIAIEQARLQESIQREQAIRARLIRYHSPALVERILRDPSHRTLLEPQEQDVTVLFADMVGFSSRAEQMAPKQLAALLNDFLTELVEVVFEHGGTLDKFIGDAVMAFFGAPQPDPRHPLRAIQTAWQMRRRVERLSERVCADPPLQVRIGISTGKAVTGDIGSPRRVEYTVLGYTVNVASRLEAFVAQPNQIVLSETTYERVRDVVEVEDLGWLDLKGLQHKVHAYALLRLKDEGR